MPRRRFSRWIIGFALIAGCSAVGYAEDEAQSNIVQLDHAVPHLSTLGVNADELVTLFVRELVREGGDQPRKAVLMVHGRNSPGVVVFDLKYRDYSWAMHLAKAGFDVFIIESQGSGRSPLPNRALAPMMDPCNVTLAQQESLLRDHPPFVDPPCPASFGFVLLNSKNEWDEIDSVVDYIIAKRGVQKVALIGISRGSIIVGPYTVLHPEKVDSLFLQAPNLNPAALPGIGDDGLAPPVNASGRTADLGTRYVPCTARQVRGLDGGCSGILADAPRPHRILPPLNPGFPAAMALAPRQDLIDRWERDIGCDGQVEVGVQGHIWQATMENDELGSKWGPPPAGAPEGSSPEGLMRNRSFFAWGWTPTLAVRLQVPTLIIFGDQDKEEGAPGLPLAVTSVRLYETLRAHDRIALLFKVACAGHLMFWERQRKVLHHLSKQWLKHGSVEGHSTGKFFVTNDGDLLPMD